MHVLYIDMTVIYQTVYMSNTADVL